VKRLDAWGQRRLRFDEVAKEEQAEGEAEPVGEQWFSPDWHGLRVQEEPLPQYLLERGMTLPVNLRAVLVVLDYSVFTRAYSREGRKALHPRTQLGLIVYGMLKRQWSLRELEALAMPTTRRAIFIAVRRGVNCSGNSATTPTAAEGPTRATRGWPATTAPCARSAPRPKARVRSNATLMNLHLCAGATLLLRRLCCTSSRISYLPGVRGPDRIPKPEQSKGMDRRIAQLARGLPLGRSAPRLVDVSTAGEIGFVWQSYGSICPDLDPYTGAAPLAQPRIYYVERCYIVQGCRKSVGCDQKEALYCLLSTLSGRRWVVMGILAPCYS
jgi:hypothetical protein